MGESVRDPNRPNVPGTYDIIYEDADRVFTARRIEVFGIYGAPDQSYIDAYCHLRRGDRTFRSDRILDMADAVTGELIRDPVGAIHAMIKEENDPGPDFRSVMQKARKGLAALVWAARADRHLSADEMTVLLDYIEARDGMTGEGGRDWKRRVADAWLDDYRPLKSEAVDAVSSFTKDGREGELVRSHAVKMLAVQNDEAERSGVERRLTQLGIKVPGQL
ncbi:MAG: hypothetical protein CML29_17345 [Rhizobiales bacterium]|nr:hypothetical protein [Hyphomicrobiales bacterium]MBA68653.1 hypothetical protein [Hyphomicrobiales bacterium]